MQQYLQKIVDIHEHVLILPSLLCFMQQTHETKDTVGIKSKHLLIHKKTRFLMNDDEWMNLMNEYFLEKFFLFLYSWVMQALYLKGIKVNFTISRIPASKNLLENVINMLIQCSVLLICDTNTNGIPMVSYTWRCQHTACSKFFNDRQWIYTVHKETYKVLAGHF